MKDNEIQILPRGLKEKYIVCHICQALLYLGKIKPNEGLAALIQKHRLMHINEGRATNIDSFVGWINASQLPKNLKPYMIVNQKEFEALSEQKSS